MRHSGISLTLKKTDVAANFVEEFQWQFLLEVVGIVTLDEVIEAVEFAPHFTGNLLAHLTRVFTGIHDATNDGSFDARIKDQRMFKCRDADLSIQLQRFAQAQVDAAQLTFHCLWLLFEHQLDIGIQQARGVLGPLQISRHPIQTIGNSR